ncbi:MAG: hypothetical protein ACO25M_09335 [Limnohabitans sp.]
MPVYELKANLPLSEWNGWIAFYAECRRRDEVARGNLMAADDAGDKMLKGFGL